MVKPTQVTLLYGLRVPATGSSLDWILVMSLNTSQRVYVNHDTVGPTVETQYKDIWYSGLSL